MGVYIRGMEMPTSCDICPFMKTNDDLSVEDYRYMYCDFPGIGEFVTDYEATRHPDCPLVPVPPHGRLIVEDDAIETAWMILAGIGYRREENPQLEQTVREVYATAPTIEVE